MPSANILREFILLLLFYFLYSIVVKIDIRVTDITGVGTGKFLGVRRIFAQISPNLPEKTPKNDLLKWLHFI